MKTILIFCVHLSFLFCSLIVCISAPLRIPTFLMTLLPAPSGLNVKDLKMSCWHLCSSKDVVIIGSLAKTNKQTNKNCFLLSYSVVNGYTASSPLKAKTMPYYGQSFKIKKWNLIVSKIFNIKTKQILKTIHGIISEYRNNVYFECFIKSSD